MDSASATYSINPCYNMAQTNNYPSFEDCVALFKNNNKNRVNILIQKPRKPFLFFARYERKIELKHRKRQELYNKIRAIHRISQKAMLRQEKENEKALKFLEMKMQGKL